MPPTPRLLRKPDVEALLAAVSGPASSALEEIAVVQRGLIPPLARAVGVAPETPWDELIAAAGVQGRWPAARARVLTAATAPDRLADPEPVLDALWDLVRELNELRTIAPAAPDL